jgi:small subunit ribosomal protein S15
MLNGEAKSKKAETISKYKIHSNDVGSPEVQVALLTDRLNRLGAHFGSNGKDVSSRMGMMKLVAQRNSLLGYLRKIDVTRYKNVVAALGLRK